MFNEVTTTYYAYLAQIATVWKSEEIHVEYVKKEISFFVFFKKLLGKASHVFQS